MINNEIREALQKVCGTLNKHRVHYMIVGGVAVGFYGYQHISGISLIHAEIKTDLDFWYDPKIENYLKLVAALKDLNVDTTPLEELVFDPQKAFLKIPHANFQTDFLPQMAGLGSFQDSRKNASREVLDGNELFILSYPDLIKNKEAVNRSIDKSDIEGMKRNES